MSELKKSDVFIAIATYLIVVFNCSVLSTRVQANCDSPSSRIIQDETEGDEAVARNARKRARELGLQIGVLPTGRWNAITDVSGVQVGHATLKNDQGLCTGVTVVVPHGGNVFQDKVPAGMIVGNGFGKFVGISQVQELGQLETPIGLTNTLSTFAVADALIRETLALEGNETIRSVNPVVGECNDGYLNDIRAMNVTAEHVREALQAAQGDAVPEGCVGAGTGTLCMGWKGGIGTSSRLLPDHLGGYTLGVLVQTNFGGILNVAGAPVGQELGKYYLQRDVERTQRSQLNVYPSSLEPASAQRLNASSIPDREWERGSCIVIVATDAPLDARQLTRIAKRALLGLGAVGSSMSHGSGDYVLAFSTHPGVRMDASSNELEERRTLLRDDRLSPLFQATKEAVEEAVINSLFMATTTTGQDGRTVEAIPIDRVIEICRQHGVVAGE